MKLPRGITGADLVKALSAYGYRPTRQVGSHVRLTIEFPKQSHLSVPMLRPLPVGTLASILKDAARQVGQPYQDLVSKLFP